MNGIELYRLARRLTKVAIRAIPPSEFRELPTAVRMVMVDVFENPDTTIGQIVDRTGFPQSHVSASVARLRELGMLATQTDPLDRRRTLVGPSATHIANVRRSGERLEPVDGVLRTVLTELDDTTTDREIEELLRALDVVGRLLSPKPPERPATCREGASC